jgi:hypothetical protein
MNEPITRTQRGDAMTKTRWTECGCEPRVSLDDGTYGCTMIAYCPTHAAAPDLLAALEEMVYEFQELAKTLGSYKVTAVADARAAIAKAKGVTP